MTEHQKVSIQDGLGVFHKSPVKPEWLENYQPVPWRNITEESSLVEMCIVYGNSHVNPPQEGDLPKGCMCGPDRWSTGRKENHQ